LPFWGIKLHGKPSRVLAILYDSYGIEPEENKNDKKFPENQTLVAIAFEPPDLNPRPLRT
jgi:hypothetical protein